MKKVFLFITVILISLNPLETFSQESTEGSKFMKRTTSILNKISIDGPRKHTGKLLELMSEQGDFIGKQSMKIADLQSQIEILKNQIQKQSQSMGQEQIQSMKTELQRKGERQVLLLLWIEESIGWLEISNPKQKKKISRTMARAIRDTRKMFGIPDPSPKK